MHHTAFLMVRSYSRFVNGAELVIRFVNFGHILEGLNSPLYFLKSGPDYHLQAATAWKNYVFFPLLPSVVDVKLMVLVGGSFRNDSIMPSRPITMVLLSGFRHKVVILFARFTKFLLRNM
jgi:hypothetical protein